MISLGLRARSNIKIFKLFPYLNNATCDERRDMWMSLVLPLFNAAWILLKAEPSEGRKERLHNLWRQTFKRFMFLSKHTPSLLVNKLVALDINGIMEDNCLVACEKWKSRQRNEEFVKDCVESKLLVRKQMNPVRGVPNVFCKIVNWMGKPCPKCKGSLLNPWHLKIAHNIEIDTSEELLSRMQNMVDEEAKESGKNKSKKLPRKDVINLLKPFLEKKMDSLREIYRDLLV